MPTIAYRFEEELLGALIYVPGQLAAVPHVQPGHFADARHREIFIGLHQVHNDHPGTWGSEFTRLLAEQVSDPAVDQTRLNDLAFSCTDVEAAVEYGQDVHAAAIRRELDASIGRLAELVDPQPFPAGHPFHRNYDPVLGLMRHYAANTGADLNIDLEVAPNGKHQQARHEEMVLADLIQRPKLVTDVESWLTPEAFTSINRRDIYQAIVSIAYGEADAGWGLVEAVRTARAAGFQPRSAELDQFSSTDTPGYIAHLARSTVTPGACLQLGRNLMADLLHTETHRQLSAEQATAAHIHGVQSRQTRADRLRTEEALIRYSAGLPSRDPAERALYQQWAELDAESPDLSLRGRTPRHQHLSDGQIRALAERRLDTQDQAARQFAVQEAHQRATRPPLSAEQIAQLEPPF